MYISRDTLSHDLNRIAVTVGKRPLLLHVDLLQIGLLENVEGREALCQAYLDLFLESFSDTALLIPTFNYDFCQNGIYDVVESPSQVGAFTDYVRKKYPETRTQTPVFNFCCLGCSSFNLNPTSEAFGPGSLWEDFTEQGGGVLFLGAPFSTNTFIHHVEESECVSYRYRKRFDGIIQKGEQKKRHTLYYRVRPLSESESVVYDWDRLENETISKFPLGRKQCLYFEAKSLFAEWSAQMKKVKRYLLK